MSNVIVSVLMLTYNHEKYIADAIEGVLNQKCSFDFELIIHDDASTDTTAKIVQEYASQYPNIIKPILQEENQLSKGVIVLRDYLPQFVHGKYIALCEGDDFWIDTNKLQKQIDFLQENPDYSMCMHNAWKYDMRLDEKTLLNSFPKTGSYPLKYQVPEGLGTKFPATASYVFRAEYWSEMPKQIMDGIVIDYPLRIYYSSKGNVFYFDEPMSVYRFSSEGSFTQKISENINSYIYYIIKLSGTYMFLNQYLNYEFDDIYRRKMCSDYLGLATAYMEKKKTDEKVEDILKFENVDASLLEKSLKIVDEDYIDEELVDFCSKYDRLYLYGTSILSRQVSRQITKHGISFEGFVVTDGYSKPDEYCDKKTCYLSEIINKDGVGIVLSIQPINEVGVVELLKQYEFVEYYRLFEDYTL